MASVSEYNKLAETYRGKRVLVTGHTGFKGAWLSIFLHNLGAKVYGYSLPPKANEMLYLDTKNHQVFSGECFADVADKNDFELFFKEVSPNFVFHLAAQPIVLDSYNAPYETFYSNVMGTVSVLDALRGFNGKCVAIIVTTDKCYENMEQVWGYRESDRLGGHDPYSASKACAELVAKSYEASFFNSSGKGQKIFVATARAGNVVGGGDYSKHRIIPDIVRSLSRDEVISVRSPTSVRPWQHVLETIYGYSLLAWSMANTEEEIQGGSWNFGPVGLSTVTVLDLVERSVARWGQGTYQISESTKGLKETSILKLCVDKSVEHLDWRPNWDFEETLDKTIDWYKAVHVNNQQPMKVTLEDIQSYFGVEA